MSDFISEDQIEKAPVQKLQHVDGFCLMLDYASHGRKWAA